MRDNVVLRLGEDRYEGYIRRRSRNRQAYWWARLSERGKGWTGDATEHASYDAAQTWVVAEAARILEGVTSEPTGN